MTLQVYNEMPVLRCANTNCKETERVPKAIRGVWFCSDRCDAIHNGKLSTMVLRYRGLA